MSQIIESFRNDHPLINLLQQPDADPTVGHVYDEDWTLCGLQITRKWRRAEHVENVCAECADHALRRAEYFREQTRRWEDFHAALTAQGQVSP